MSETQTQATDAADWQSVLDAIQHPKMRPLVKSYSGFHWLLKKHSRRLVESGALIKAGKNWAVSVSRAPVVIEEIYREQTLAALNHAA